MEYIEISERFPIYGSEKDYIKTQGVNACVLKYNFEQKINKKNSYKEKFSTFIFRKNHKIMEKYIYNRESQSFTGNYVIKIELETGEALNFEFYNPNERTTEFMKINVLIEKLA